MKLNMRIIGLLSVYVFVTTAYGIEDDTLNYRPKRQTDDADYIEYRIRTQNDWKSAQVLKDLVDAYGRDSGITRPRMVQVLDESRSAYDQRQLSPENPPSYLRSRPTQIIHAIMPPILLSPQLRSVFEEIDSMLPNSQAEMLKDNQRLHAIEAAIENSMRNRDASDLLSYYTRAATAIASQNPEFRAVLSGALSPSVPTDVMGKNLFELFKHDPAFEAQYRSQMVASNMGELFDQIKALGENPDNSQLQEALMERLGVITGTVLDEIKTSREQIQEGLGRVEQKIEAHTQSEVDRARAQHQEEEFKHRVRGLHAGVNVIAAVASLSGNPKLANSVSVIGTSFINTFQAVREFNKSVDLFTGTFSNILSGALLTGDVLGSVMSIAGLFMNQPSTDQLILEQLSKLGEFMAEQFNQLHQEINALHEDMREHFQRVDQRLDDIFEMTTRGFDQVLLRQDMQMTMLMNATQKLEEIHQAVTLLRSETNQGFRSQLNAPLLERLNLCLLTPEDLSETDIKEKCLNYFRTYAKDLAKDYPFMIQPSSVDSSHLPQISENLKPFPSIFQTFNYLYAIAHDMWWKQSLTQPSGGGRSVPQIAFHNPEAWATGVHFYINTIDKWQKYPGLARTDVIDELTDVGEQIQAATVNLLTAKNENLPSVVGGDALFKTIMEDGYIQAVREELPSALQTLEKEFLAQKGYEKLSILDGSSFDVASQPVPELPKISTIPPCEGFEKSSDFIYEELPVDSRFLNKLSQQARMMDYLKFGKLSVCYAFTGKYEHLGTDEEQAGISRTRVMRYGRGDVDIVDDSKSVVTRFIIEQKTVNFDVYVNFQFNDNSTPAELEHIRLIDNRKLFHQKRRTRDCRGDRAYYDDIYRGVPEITAIEPPRPLPSARILDLWTQGWDEEPSGFENTTSALWGHNISFHNTLSQEWIVPMREQFRTYMLNDLRGRGVGHLSAVFEKLETYRLWLESYLRLGLSRSLQMDDFVRSVVYGQYRLADREDFAQMWVAAALEGPDASASPFLAPLRDVERQARVSHRILADKVTDETFQGEDLQLVSYYLEELKRLKYRLPRYLQTASFVPETGGTRSSKPTFWEEEDNSSPPAPTPTPEERDYGPTFRE